MNIFKTIYTIFSALFAPKQEAEKGAVTVVNNANTQEAQAPQANEKGAVTVVRKNKIEVIEKCERLDAYTPKWEIYANGRHVTTCTRREYLNATIRYYRTANV